MPVVLWQVTPPQSDECRQGLAESQNPKEAVQVPLPSSQQPLVQSLALEHGEQMPPPELQVHVPAVALQAIPPQTDAVAHGRGESQKPAEAEQVRPEPLSQQPLLQSEALPHGEQIAPALVPELPELPELLELL